MWKAMNKWNQANVGTVTRISLIALGFSAITGCARGAITFYPPQVIVASDADPVRPEEVIVILDDATPECDFFEIGSFSYDWARDGVLTSAQMCINSIRKAAARKGADGIYKIEYTPGSMGETGATAVAYRCR